MLSAGISNHLTDLEIFSILLASLIHDFEHPGVTNGPLSLPSRHTISPAPPSPHALSSLYRTTVPTHFLLAVFLSAVDDKLAVR